MNTLSLFYLISVMIVFTACTAKSENRNIQDSANPIVHPADHAFLPDSVIDSVINTSDINDTPLYTENELLVRIGKNDGKMEYILGSVIGAGIVGDNFLVIADNQQNVIRVYDAVSGKFLFPLARKGRGPGELLEISSIETSGQIVAVSDRMQKIEIFEFKEEQEIENRLINLDFTPQFLCLLGDQLFVSGFHYERKNTIHVYDLKDGEYIKSFHDAYPSDSFMAQLMLSSNRIACNVSTGSVAVVNPYLPYIYGYNSKGEQLWITKIESFDPVQVTEYMNENGRPTIDKSIRPDGVTNIYSNFISFEDSNYYLLQMNKLHLKDGKNVNGQFLTMKIDANTGFGNVSSSKRSIIENVSKYYTISKTNYPYPQISVYERQDP